MPSVRASRCSKPVRWTEFPNVIAEDLRAVRRKPSARLDGRHAKAVQAIARVDPTTVRGDPAAVAVRANPRENRG